MHRSIVTYLRTANVPGQCMRRTTACVAVRGDNAAMRPLAKLLWTHLLLSVVDVSGSADAITNR